MDMKERVAIRNKILAMEKGLKYRMGRSIGEVNIDGVESRLITKILADLYTLRNGILSDFDAITHEMENQHTSKAKKISCKRIDATRVYEELKGRL